MGPQLPNGLHARDVLTERAPIPLGGALVPLQPHRGIVRPVEADGVLPLRPSGDAWQLGPYDVARVVQITFSVHLLEHRATQVDHVDAPG